MLSTAGYCQLNNTSFEMAVVTVYYVLSCLLLGCYGVSGDEAELDDWLCARCEASAITEVSSLGWDFLYLQWLKSLHTLCQRVFNPGLKLEYMLTVFITTSLHIAQDFLT